MWDIDNTPELFIPALESVRLRVCGPQVLQAEKKIGSRILFAVETPDMTKLVASIIPRTSEGGM